VFKESRHLAIFNPESIAKVIQNRQKIDIRLSQRAIPPYQAIKRGDKIFIKKSGGGIYGEAKVSNVLFFSKLNPAEVDRLRKRYGQRLSTAVGFWDKKKRAKFATVIFFDSVKRYLAPVKYAKSDRRAWVVIESVS